MLSFVAIIPYTIVGRGLCSGLTTVEWLTGGSKIASASAPVHREDSRPHRIPTVL